MDNLNVIVGQEIDQTYTGTVADRRDDTKEFRVVFVTKGHDTPEEAFDAAVDLLEEAIMDGAFDEDEDIEEPLEATEQSFFRIISSADSNGKWFSNLELTNKVTGEYEPYCGVRNLDTLDDAINELTDLIHITAKDLISKVEAS